MAHLDVALVLGLRDRVSFIRIGHQLGRDAERLQRVPEPVALRRRHLGIAIAVQRQSGGGVS